MGRDIGGIGVGVTSSVWIVKICGGAEIGGVEAVDIAAEVLASVIAAHREADTSDASRSLVV